MTFDVDRDGLLTVSARENKFFARNESRSNLVMMEFD